MLLCPRRCARGIIVGQMNVSEFNRCLKNASTDCDSFDKLYTYFFKRIVFHLQKFGQTIAEDATQDFFTNIRVHLGEYTYIDNPTAWIYKCADNVALKLLDKDKRYAESFSLEEPAADAEDLYGDLYSAIKTLNVTERTLITLRYWKGYTLKYAAKILSIDYNRSKQVFARALQKIKKAYKKYSDMTNKISAID